MAEQVAIEEGLFTWPSDDPRLLGSQCQDCGASYSLCNQVALDALQMTQSPKS